MDISQLKLLATRIRSLLQQSNVAIGHNQSLDLAAAIPGFRNWPEVLAFEDRLIGCHFDASASSRLSYRLKKKFDVDLSPQRLLDALRPSESERSQSAAPLIWPSGPTPGVYLTTSPDAIKALLESYEEATDGAIVYAERAGNDWPGSIDLGEYGLWSNGLNRVPSGTLLVLGPLEFNQQAWTDSSSHLEMACLLALNSGHRIAVLVDTPVPGAMFEDALLMVQSVQEDGSEADTGLIGLVTDDGELQARRPFAKARQAPQAVKSVATTDAIPSEALPSLRAALAAATSGIVLFGCSRLALAEHDGIDLVASALALTEHVGPAARIMPRRRGTPSKDWNVPDAIKQLPFLPSIESAYDQGYRRLVYDPTYTKAEVLRDYAQDTLLISGTWGSSVLDLVWSVFRGGGVQKESEVLAHVIAILGITPLPQELGSSVLTDLYIAERHAPIDALTFDDIETYLESKRVLRWEQQLDLLLDANIVTADRVKEHMPRHRSIAQYFADREGLAAGR